MNSYFVDKAGRIHCGNSAGIKALVPTRPDSFQAQQQLSMVAGVQARRGLAAIRVIPDRLSYAAYATLATLLETFAPERIALSWHQGGWHDEIIGRTASAAWHCAGQRVLALMTKARLEHDDRYQISTGSVDDIPSAGGMRRLIELWRFSGLNIDMAAQRQQVSELLGKVLRHTFRSECYPANTRYVWPWLGHLSRSDVGSEVRWTAGHRST